MPFKTSVKPGHDYDRIKIRSDSSEHIAFFVEPGYITPNRITAENKDIESFELAIFDIVDKNDAAFELHRELKDELKNARVKTHDKHAEKIKKVTDAYTRLVENILEQYAEEIDQLYAQHTERLKDAK